tara:strand:- start:2037 stop:2636 length:600 start_codon:yes stop_codon:yes gene_type:complete
MQAYYERFLEFPVFKEYINVYSPSSANESMVNIKKIYDIKYRDLSRDCGMSPFLIGKFVKNEAAGNSRVYDLYTITQVIDNPKFAKANLDHKKLKLLNPSLITKTLKQQGILNEDIFKFLQGQFSEEKVLYNLKGGKKTLTFDLAVALTACHKWYKKESTKVHRKKFQVKSQNARRRMEYNDRIERYLRGDLSPVQKKS